MTSFSARFKRLDGHEKLKLFSFKWSKSQYFSKVSVSRLASSFRREYLQEELIEKMSVAERETFRKTFTPDLVRGQLNIEDVS